MSPAAEEGAKGLRLAGLTGRLEPLFEVVPEAKRRLGFYVLLAALVHILGFMIIRVAEPVPVLSSGGRARVTLATPALLNAEQRREMEYLDLLHDPSRLILSANPADTVRRPRLLGGSGVPGLGPASASASAAAALAPSGLALPDALPPLRERLAQSMMPPRMPYEPAVPPAPPAAPSPTAVRFSPSLRGLVLGSGPRFEDPATELPAERGTTTIRLAVEPNGLVRHALLVEGTGIPALDAKALDTLRQTRFRPQPDRTLPAWGDVTIYWRFAAPAARSPNP